MFYPFTLLVTLILNDRLILSEANRRKKCNASRASLLGAEFITIRMQVTRLRLQRCGTKEAGRSEL